MSCASREMIRSDVYARSSKASLSVARPRKLSSFRPLHTTTLKKGACTRIHTHLSRSAAGHNRRVVVGDLPVTALLTPHVGEARRYRLAVGTLTELKGVHARVQVGQAVFVHLHAVVGDGAEGVLEDKLLEVVFGEVPALDVLGRDRRQEGEAGGIQGGNLLGVLGLQGIVPRLEVALRVRMTETLSEPIGKSHGDAKASAGRAHPGSVNHLRSRRRGLYRCSDGGASSGSGASCTKQTLTSQHRRTAAQTQHKA